MSTALAPNRMSLPPPQFDLVDLDQVVGWVRGNTVGFRGFAHEVEAAHGSWVAFRTLSRRLAQGRGERPVPIDGELLAVARDDDRERILASNRPFAVLLRPGPDSRTGPDSFGFEIEVPPPTDELAVRAMAHVMYRTLRKSGIRWAMWSRGARHAA